MLSEISERATLVSMCEIKRDLEWELHPLELTLTATIDTNNNNIKIQQFFSDTFTECAMVQNNFLNYPNIFI